MKARYGGKRSKGRRTARYTRSGVKVKSILEKDVLDDLSARGLAWEYETVQLKWLDVARRSVGECQDCGGNNIGTWRTYTPDIIMPNNLVIEIKGLFSSADRAKMKAVVRQYPDLEIRMLFGEDRWLTSANKTRYSSWCARAGITCAVGRAVPEEWIHGDNG